MLNRIVSTFLRKAPEIVANKVVSEVERALDEPVSIRREDRKRARKLLPLLVRSHESADWVRLPGPPGRAGFLAAAHRLLVERPEEWAVVGLGTVAALASATRAHLVDLAWTRLHPWRNALARFFDDPSLRPAVTAIRRVKIVTTLTEGGAMAEVAQYLVGWLAGRLGWRFVSGQTAIDPFHRAIDLELEWRGAPLPPGTLLAVELDSHLGDTPVTMSVEREGDPPFLCARHDAQERGQGERVTPLASLPLVGLLDRAIADPTSDAVLRATIERAIGYPPGAPPPAVREGGAT